MAGSDTSEASARRAQVIPQWFENRSGKRLAVCEEQGCCNSSRVWLMKHCCAVNTGGLMHQSSLVVSCALVVLPLTLLDFCATQALAAHSSKGPKATQKL